LASCCGDNGVIDPIKFFYAIEEVLSQLNT
jgi:hypothetical protein